MSLLADFSKVENSPYSYVSDKHDKNLTFVIHRNNNKNVVVYTANLTDDRKKLKKDEPLKVYWIMFEKNGHPTEGLNVIERNSAYGLSCSPWDGKEDHYKVILTALKDREIDLFIENGKPVGKGVINGIHNCTMQRVFVQSTTSWGLPKVEFIEIYGLDPNGKEIKEKKIP